MMLTNAELHHDERKCRVFGSLIGFVNATHGLNVEPELLQQLLSVVAHDVIVIDKQDRLHGFRNHLGMSVARKKSI
jgi:hypothetical protein